MCANRSCALVSQGGGGYFYSANYYFMTVIYFMLSALCTPKLAIVWGPELVGLSCCFSEANLTILWVEIFSRSKEERVLLKRILHMKCNLDKYSKLLVCIFKVYFSDTLIALLYLH